MLVIFAAAALRCGYSLVGRGSTLPAGVRVIRFQTLQNGTSRVGVEQRVSREIARELATRGRFEVRADARSADAELSGTVTQFDLYAVAFDELGQKAEAVVSLQYVIHEHPASEEARLARARLKSIGVEAR